MTVKSYALLPLGGHLSSQARQFTEFATSDVKGRRRRIANVIDFPLEGFSQPLLTQV